MKVQVKVLEAKAGYGASGYGSDSGSVTLKVGDVVVLEGASISLSGSDGVGDKEVATADTPPAP